MAHDTLSVAMARTPTTALRRVSLGRVGTSRPSVVVVPYHGVVVRQVSLEFASEVYEFRAGFDSMAGALAAGRPLSDSRRRDCTQLLRGSCRPRSR